MFKKLIKFVAYHSKWVMNERGGGSKTEVVSAPTTPAPNPADTAAAQYEARLKYDPLVAQQTMDIQKQQVPQQAALYQSMYNQYYPELARQQQALQRELYPQQSQILEAGAQTALSQLKSAYGLAPEDQYTIQERERLREQMRATRNIGGGLYGGRGYAAEDKAVENLSQAYRQQAQQNLNPYMQILYPQIGTQQPNVGAFQYQSAVPSADTLYNAYFQASQPNQYYNPGSPSPLWGLAGSLGGAAISKYSSIRYKENVKLWE